MQPYPPLGTLYAASVLRNAESQSRCSTPCCKTRRRIPASARRTSPKIVAVYEDDFNFLSKMCLTRMREVAFEMMRISRTQRATVIVHGSDATDNAAEYLERVLPMSYGEAEIDGWRDLVSDLAAQTRTWRNVRAMHTWINDGRFVSHTPERGPGWTWLNLPAPARDLDRPRALPQRHGKSHGYFSLNLVASRGCPFRCNWCAKPIYGDSFTFASKRVAEEMRELKERYGAEHLWFADDIFALDRRWVREFADTNRETSMRSAFKIQSRADLMTPKRFAL